MIIIKNASGISVIETHCVKDNEKHESEESLVSFIESQEKNKRKHEYWSAFFFQGEQIKTAITFQT